MIIKKTELNKLIKFSPFILLEQNKIYFLKYDAENKLILDKKVINDVSLIKNKFVFITKEIKESFESFGTNVKIYVDNEYISFNNVKVELINTVVKNVR